MPANRLSAVFLESALDRFRNYREMGDKTLAQLAQADLLWQPGPECNSIAILVQHLSGNMRSRWTDFLTRDGEKPDRDRDAEFEPHRLTRRQLLERWEVGWQCLFDGLATVHEENLTREVVIRGQSLSVVDAIHRQLMHAAYHIGQMVELAKARKGAEWKTLSIPRGQSGVYRPEKRD